MSDRKELAVRIQALLLQFWLADDTEDAMRVIELETWLDTLGDVSPDEFRAAVVEYQRSGPRTARGRLLKPDAGAIWKMVVGVRPPPPRRPTPLEPPRPKPVTKEEAAEIMKVAFGRRYDPETGVLLPAPELIKRFGGPLVDGDE